MDDRDTIVDPQIRREVQAPRPDARRPLLLIAIVATSAMLGAGVMAVLLITSDRVPHPTVTPRAAPAPVAVPAPVAPVEQPAPVAPVEPSAPPPAVAPEAPTGEALTPRPCPSYRQKHLGADEQPARTDCPPEP